MRKANEVNVERKYLATVTWLCAMHDVRRLSGANRQAEILNACNENGNDKNRCHFTTLPTDPMRVNHFERNDRIKYLNGVALNVICFRVELLFEVDRLMILKHSPTSAEPL